MSNRCDAAVKKFKYVLVKFDGNDNDPTFSLDNQLAFFSNIDLPLLSHSPIPGTNPSTASFPSQNPYVPPMTGSGK
jgi:hypothetical protein